MPSTPPDDDSRTEPSDIKAEQAVLGAMIQSPAALADCLDALQPGHFYRPAHQEIFTVIRCMDTEGVPVDAITLRQRLDAAHVKYGGAPYLIDLMQAVPSAANAGWYAARIHDIAGRRSLLAASRMIAATALDPGLDAADRADRAGRAVDDAVDSETSDGAVPIGDLLPAFLEGLESSEQEPVVPTGIIDLDAILSGGFRPGELVTVGARPSMGKSVFLGCIAARTAITGQQPVVLWSLEMSRDEIMQRIISNLAKVPLTLLRERKLGDAEWKRVNAVFPTISAAPLFINDRPYLKLHDLRADLRRARHRGHPAALGVLDYLQLMTSAGKPENRQLEVAELARGLKLMAKEFGIPVIGASQLNRGPEARADHRPLLGDLRESGAVEQDSDIVILLHRDDAYERDTPRAGEIDLIVAKNRNGATSTVAAVFQGHHSRIGDLAKG